MTKLTELSKKYCSRIKSPLSIEQICEQIESSEYSAELMLQHLVLAAAELEKDNAILQKKYNILFQWATDANVEMHKAIMDALEVDE